MNHLDLVPRVYRKFRIIQANPDYFANFWLWRTKSRRIAERTIAGGSEGRVGSLRSFLVYCISTRSRGAGLGYRFRLVWVFSVFFLLFRGRLFFWGVSRAAAGWARIASCPSVSYLIVLGSSLYSGGVSPFSRTRYRS